ncbi:ABC-F family ATP-binding cassette domain-containing protein [Pseudolysinimonas sp.]|uniref:ABC-F family ATP-binding cassette domain-containing protein n=1 Tax=Pseudolysinimonas sp. TaxID=2680009 RepID=UPI003F7E9FCE
MPSRQPVITLSHVGLTWPDGAVALDDVSGAIGAGRTGLVGANGAGKSTLLRLVAGELRPTSGTVTTVGDVVALPQTLTLRTGAPVAELLGVAPQLAAVRAIEAGDVDERHFDAVGDDWDVEARAEAVLAEVGLPIDALDRRVAELSGGEAMLVAIAGLRLRRAPITLLDEPTNNLDRDARARVADLVRSWSGALVVVSHDTALLELMDDTAELYRTTLTTFGGPYSAWREALDREQAAAAQAARSAEQVLRAEKRQRIDAQTKLQHRERTAKKAEREKRVPKIVAHGRRMEAQVSAGRLRGEMEALEESARVALDAAEERMRDDDGIRVDLPDPGVARGRRIAELAGRNRTIVIQGPERVALVGPNGIGKTTLLERMLVEHVGAGGGAVASGSTGGATGTLLTDRVGYLPQRLDGLDDDATVLDAVRSAAPSAPPGEIRNRLARFLLRGDAVARRVGTLSGGERFRVALARLLLADPPPQLLVLDEPTNNLDLPSVEQLVSALRSYRGALLVVSHDDAFLSRLDLTATIALDAQGDLAERVE